MASSSDRRWLARLGDLVEWVSSHKQKSISQPNFQPHRCGFRNTLRLSPLPLAQRCRSETLNLGSAVDKNSSRVYAIRSHECDDCANVESLAQEAAWQSTSLLSRFAGSSFLMQRIIHSAALGCCFNRNEVSVAIPSKPTAARLSVSSDSSPIVSCQSPASHAATSARTLGRCNPTLSRFLMPPSNSASLSSDCSMATW